MKSLRVLLLNDYATDTAGAERITLGLRDSLRSAGHEVRVFASNAKLIAAPGFANATCHGTNGLLQPLTSLWNVSAYRALRDELRTFRPDVVQVQMFLWQLSPSILSLLARVPSVYYAMTYKSVCPTGFKLLPSGRRCQAAAGAVCLRERCVSLPGFLPRMLQRQLWRRQRGAFSAIVACSHALGATLREDGISVTDVIWPGTATASVRSSPGDIPTITFAGRMDRTKGVDVLLQAFARVRARVPAARLVLAGTGPEEQAMRGLAGTLALGEDVEFTGQLHGDALEGLFARSWVHAVPSVWAEPFGLTTTEAMMRGVAVVGSDIGGIAETVVAGETGHRVPPGDADALAVALLSVLMQPGEVQRLGENARALALRSFTLSAAAGRFEALYRSIGAAA